MRNIQYHEFLREKGAMGVEARLSVLDGLHIPHRDPEHALSGDDFSHFVHKVDAWDAGSDVHPCHVQRGVVDQHWYIYDLRRYGWPSNRSVDGRRNGHPLAHLDRSFLSLCIRVGRTPYGVAPKDE